MPGRCLRRVIRNADTLDTATLVVAQQLLDWLVRH